MCFLIPRCDSSTRVPVALLHLIFLLSPIPSYLPLLIVVLFSLCAVLVCIMPVHFGVETFLPLVVEQN